MAPSPARPGGPEPSNAPPPSKNTGSNKQTDNGLPNQPGSPSTAPAKKKKHRAGKKRRNRRQSFASSQDMSTGDTSRDRPGLPDVPEHSSFYRLRNNLSNTSLESEALLDHRDHPTIRARRPSAPVTSMYQQHSSPAFGGSPQRFQPTRSSNSYGRSRLSDPLEGSHDNGDDYADDNADDRIPLMTNSQRDIRMSASYGGVNAPSGSGRQRRSRRSSMSSSRLGPGAFSMHHSQSHLLDYDINNPPSVPTSPVFEANTGLEDVMLTADLINLSDHDQTPNRSLRCTY